MPKNKDAYSRYKIIDQYIRKNNYAKTSRLAEVCSEKLGIPISVRTIQKDILDLVEDTVLQIYAPIQYSKTKKAYYYPENVDNIFPAIELNEDEINALIFYGKIHNQYKSLGLFQDIKNAIEKIIDNTNIKQEHKDFFTSQPLILIENTPRLKGSEQLVKITQALKQERQIIFDYKKFRTTKSTEHKLSPYLLKEDKNMWYVIGYYEMLDTIKTFAIDRMSKIRLLDTNCIKKEFNPQEYFKYSIGITANLEIAPIEVILSFKPKQGDYIKTLPIHQSQQILKDNKNELRISIKVKPTYEFYSKILSYGADMKILSPESVKNEYKEKLVAALKQY